MKKQLVFSALFGAAVFLGAADTCDSLCKAGHLLHKERKWDEAAAKFESALKLAKNDNQRYSCCNYRCAVLMDAKKYEEAVQAAKEALKYAAAPDKEGISPQQSVIYWRIGLSYNYANKGAESFAAYSTSAKLAPRDSWMFTNSSCSAGVRANWMKKYDEAEKHFRQCFECEKASPDARMECYFQLATQYSALNKAQEALKLLEEAERLWPKFNDGSKNKIWDARGRVYYGMKKFDEAAKAFEEALKYTGNNDSCRAFAYGQLACIYRGKKDLANAAKYARLCLDCKKASWGRDVRLCNSIIDEYQKSLKK